MGPPRGRFPDPSPALVRSKGDAMVRLSGSGLGPGSGPVLCPCRFYPHLTLGAGVARGPCNLDLGLPSFYWLVPHSRLRQAGRPPSWDHSRRFSLGCDLHHVGGPAAGETRRAADRRGAGAERVDERDTIFARARYRPGTAEHEDYYSCHPELKEVDDHFRTLPELGAPGGQYFDPSITPLANATFEFLQQVGHLVEGEVEQERVGVDPAEMARRIKGQGAGALTWCALSSGGPR